MSRRPRPASRTGAVLPALALAAACADEATTVHRDVSRPMGLDMVGRVGGGATDDFEGNGLLDVIVSSWGIRDKRRYFRNEGDGNQDVFQALGGAFDGDLGRSVLLTNPGHGSRWITLSLEGVPANRAAVGARIRVTVEMEEGTRDIHHLLGSGGSFGSNPLRAYRIREGEAQPEPFDLPRVPIPEGDPP